MKTLDGQDITHIHARGRAFLMRKTPLQVSEITAEAPEAEYEKFSLALEQVTDELSLLQKQAECENDAALLEVQIFMAMDPDFIDRVRYFIIEKNLSAAHAVKMAAEAFSASLTALGNEHFSERVHDIKDVAERIIMRLTGTRREKTVLPPDSVLVAEELLPSGLIALNRENLRGIVLEQGGATSHVALLAKSYGIALFMNAKDALELISDGDDILLSGKIYVNPDASAPSECDEDLSAFLPPAYTNDGKRIRIYANVDSWESVEQALSMKAEGIGLFRTEFLLMGDGPGRDEEASFELYSRISKAFDGPVTVRTYDVGYDKMVHEGEKPEKNPALGVRGIRFCMSHRELFRTQLRALLRASASKGNIRVMFPMISSPDELDGVLDFFDEVKRELASEGIPYDENIKVGTMIEVPSAAIMSDVLAKKCDFFSIGTNDLMQYTIAVDRASEKLSYLAPPLHPAVARLIAMVVRSASEAGIETCVCGEAAGDERLIPILTGLGLNALSMASVSIPSVVRAVRKTDIGKASLIAGKVLHAGSIKETETLTEESNAETGDRK